MNELENTQPEETPEVVEMEESVESSERVEEQAVDDATHDPGARIEETQDFEQAEAIEAALGEAIDNAEQVSDLPVPIPGPADIDSGEEISGLPIPTPGPADIDSGEEISDMPIPLPEPALEEPPPEQDSHSAEGGDDDADATPITLP